MNCSLDTNSLHELNTSFLCQDDDEDKYEIIIWYWTLRWLLATITILGNAFFIILIVLRPNLRTKKHWFVLSLAVADLLIGAFNCPTEFLETIHDMDYTFDKAQTYFLDVSSTCLVAMTMDRYMAIMHPFKYQSFMTKRHLIGLIVLSWLIPLFIRLPLVIGLGDPSALDNYDCFTIILLRGVPLVLLPMTFAPVVLVVRRTRRRMLALRAQLAFNHPWETRPRDHAKRRVSDSSPTRSSVNATAAVILFYCCCNAIDVWDMIVHFFNTEYALHDTSSDVGVLLVNLSSAANFVIYGFLQSEFRREVKAFCCFS